MHEPPDLKRVIRRLEKMIDGCTAVREFHENDKNIKEITQLIIRDCNRVIAVLKGKRLVGDYDF